jgi:hypothetical protein
MIAIISLLKEPEGGGTSPAERDSALDPRASVLDLAHLVLIDETATGANMVRLTRCLPMADIVAKV